MARYLSGGMRVIALTLQWRGGALAAHRALLGNKFMSDIIPTADMMVTHTKTGKVYQVLDIVTNATNGAQNGQYMVVYCDTDGEGKSFVREYHEFCDGRFVEAD